jgi:hypothetical protein
MVFNATFNNISVISWQSVLLEEETRGPRENHRHVASHQVMLSIFYIDLLFYLIYVMIFMFHLD